jgi:hypothetical protein
MKKNLMIVGLLIVAVAAVVGIKNSKQTKAEGDAPGCAGGVCTLPIPQDVVNPFSKVWNFFFQSLDKTAGDFAQEYARFCKRVEKRYRRVRPDIRAAVVGGPRFGQRVEHPVGKLRRRKHLVI